jgi:hypothetical protein
MLLLVQAFPMDLQKLKVDSSHRYLIKEDGTPFVWIGATMWKWKSLSIDQIKQIMDDHASKGYNVIHLIAYPGKYDIVDTMIDYAAKKGIYIGIVTGWYRDILRTDKSELYERGFELGKRYRDKNNIIWLSAGEAGGHHRKDIIPDENMEALVKGIRDGDTGNKLLTIHADYKRGTSIDNDADIVDFNNWQTSQWCCPNDLPRHDSRNWTVWEAISHDYNLSPIKPTLDSEAWYENNKSHCGATPFAIRRRAYFTILAGAFGHTYGAGGIWDGLTESKECSGNWQAALQYEGYIQIGYMGAFFRSLGEDFIQLVPEQNFIVEGNSENYDTHIQAAITKSKMLALIYSASDSKYTLDIGKLSYNKSSAKWYNPRNNELHYNKEVLVKEEQRYKEFDPPGEVGPGNDWVLILEANTNE